MRENKLGVLARAIDNLEGEPIPFNLCKSLFEIRAWISEQEAREGDKGFREEVPSDTRPGLMHTVMFSERDGFCCTCEDYKYRYHAEKNPHYECKHIKKVKKERGFEEL